MEWVLSGPQTHNSFSNLGYALPDGYHINENCNSTLEEILENLVTEDRYLRTYRRSISFGQNIKKDLIPLLLYTKDDKTVELLIKILVNLTIPVECLLSLETVSKNDTGRHTIFEINSLLSSTKVALTDHRVTKVIMDFLKKNFDNDQIFKLSVEQCTNISNTLLFLRNILHIPEDVNPQNPMFNGPPHTVQNQLIWNLFSQSIDKVLIKLMTIPAAINWGVTMVQLIALLYKDQHVTTLHKLLNLWLEATLSESSEDNESNTSPPNRGSDHSSPMLTSDPTSDSSDTAASGKCNAVNNSTNNAWDDTSRNSESDKQNSQLENTDNIAKESSEANNIKKPEASTKQEDECKDNGTNTSNNNVKKGKSVTISENSDCGYGTQIENQESISTSSNEDEVPTKKPVHQKPHTSKQRVNNKARPNVTLQERKRKKFGKKSKSNTINAQGLAQSMPTDDDISNVLKEFTIDFLLKGYNALIRTLHSQILTNVELEIDTSHFFWLLTYFLKFATQIELDLEHVSCVLSYEIVSYLTAEGVNLCEQFELAIKLDRSDLKPCVRRLHLVVTAIREFVQAIEVYKKSANTSNNHNEQLDKLQLQMCETDDLRSLFVLLLKYYNPRYHSKQYLQDLIVTNHNLLLFMDGVMQNEKASPNMVDHIKQFCSAEIMYQYGLLLEDYEGNGEFVNDCIFTIMHHVAGELGSPISLFQPKILRIFTAICKSEFEICDDWTDLIEYVINTFVKKPYNLQSSIKLFLDDSKFDDPRLKEIVVPANSIDKLIPEVSTVQDKEPSDPNKSVGWTDDELSTLSWNYMQCNSRSDVVGEIVRMFKDDGIIKTRDAVVKELYKQFIISKEQFVKLQKKEPTKTSETMQDIKNTRESEIGKLCEQLKQDGKAKFLDWVQTVILEACWAKIYLNKTDTCEFVTDLQDEKTFENFIKKPKDLPVLSSVCYHSLLFNRSVPLVPWNCEQSSICKDLKFLQLLHKLGFHMPVDSGKVFIRIPYFWSPDVLYEVAGKISPIDISKIKFSLSDISESSILSSAQTSNFILPEMSKGDCLPPIPDNIFQIHNKNKNYFASMVNFTPMPGTSFTSDDNLNKPSWLAMVQKSHDYKINLDLGKSLHDDNMDSTSPNKGHNEDEVCISLEATSHPLDETVGSGATLLSPSSMDQEPATFTIGPPESDFCNNSVCDTASVASDLTRMYVSDEDDKPELVIRVDRTLKTLATVLPPEELDNCDTESCSDGESTLPEKRPRVDFRLPL